jgi:hypothetical protein
MSIPRILITLIFFFAPFSRASSPLFPEGVGSNLPFLSLGSYATSPTGENWSKDVKTTLLHYHENPAEIRSRLADMHAHGQSKISLLLWYVQEGDPRTSFAHVICPHHGQLPPQVQSNLTNIIHDIASAGFDTVILRLAAQGAADPLGEHYDPARANDSWSLFEHLHTLTDSALKGTSLHVLYDLGAETMAHPYSTRPGAQAFLKLMWHNYTQKYPPSQTIGFSLNHAASPGTTESLQIFQDSGIWPAYLAIDIYTNPDQTLKTFAASLAHFQKSTYPIIILETYRNNPTMAQSFAAAQQKYHLNFRSLLQWPLDPNFPGHSNNPLTPDISQYTIPTLEK